MEKIEYLNEQKLDLRDDQLSQGELAELGEQSGVVLP